MPISLLVGTFRFLCFEDFKAQFFHGILIEVFTVTIPYIVVISVYTVERNGMFFFGALGISIHLTSLLFAVRHIHAA